MKFPPIRNRHAFVYFCVAAFVVDRALAQEPAGDVRLGAVADRALKLDFVGSEGRVFRVERSKDLVTWTPLPLPAERIAAGMFQAFDPDGPEEHSVFYRIVTSMPPTDQAVPEAVFRRLPKLGESGIAPSFSTAFPESVLVPENDPAFGLGADDLPARSPEALIAQHASGLAAWRKIGNHGSCISCHAPDAFDLAVIGYSDEDITRRALDHVSAEDAEKIVGLVHAVRQMEGITRPLHPRRFRPLQPGYEVLPGTTDSERDLAFGRYLRDEIGLIWARERITSPAQARAAQRQLLALDLRKLRVGIPFDLWSADGHHGAEHRSVAEWLPMMGVQPRAGRSEDWHALHDAYLAEPTDRNFWAYYDRIDEFLVPIEPAGHELGQTWSLLKYKSVQLAQHMMRRQTLQLPDPLADRTGTAVAHRSTILARNPLFRTGDHVRRFPLQTDPANPSTTFPSFLASTLPGDQAALRRQNESFFRVWFWMAWANDPALLHSDSIFQTVEGDYLYASLLQHFKLHHAFVVAMTSVAKANATSYFATPGPGVAGHGKWASFTPFMVLHHIERNRNEPGAGDARRAQHDFLFANTARMWIYLVQDDLVQTGRVFDRELVRGSIRFCRGWLDATEPTVDHTDIDLVVADLETRLNTAMETRTDFSTPDLPGGLPFN